jgi:predicted AAA+ superfamily ATPase
VCRDNELVIATWSPIHLRTKLKDFYWKANKSATKASDFWGDTLRYLYLPRLKDRGVLAQAIVKGAGTRDFFGTRLFAPAQVDSCLRSHRGKAFRKMM